MCSLIIAYISSGKTAVARLYSIEEFAFKLNYYLILSSMVITQWASLPSVICGQIHTYMSMWNGVALFVSVS
jgi:hypothetical protein